MKTVTHIAALATALLIGSATLAGPATRATAENPADIEWTASPDRAQGSTPQVQFNYRTSNISFSVGGGADLAELRTALADAGPASFTIAREPGTLTCRGTMRKRHDGRGSCTFAPDRSFEADLRARDLAPRGWSELLGMTLLGVDRGLIDGLIREGVPPETADDAIAAAALEVTPEYVAGLKAAGLELRSLDDAVACRALDVDAAYVKAMADAGYRAEAEQVIAMKATGVTPEYARRMNAAARQ